MECLDPGMARARSGCCSCAGARVCVCASTDGVHECMSDHGVHETVGMVCVGACVCGAWGVCQLVTSREGDHTKCLAPSNWCWPQYYASTVRGQLGFGCEGGLHVSVGQKKKTRDTQADVHNELNECNTHLMTAPDPP